MTCLSTDKILYLFLLSQLRLLAKKRFRNKEKLLMSFYFSTNSISIEIGFYSIPIKNNKVCNYFQAIYYKEYKDVQCSWIEE